MKPRRLKIARLDEISLVDRGANPLARVLVWKRDTPKDDKKMPEPQDKTEAIGLLRKLADAMGFARELAADDKFEKRVKQMPNGKWMAMNDAGEEMGMFDTEEEARRAAYGEKKKMAEPKDEAVTKAVEEMQKKLDDLTKRAEKAEADAKAEADKVAKLETERRDAEFAKRAEGYAPLPIKADTFAPILRKAADVLTAEENAELDRVLTAAAAAMKASGIMKEIGSGGHEDGTAMAKVNARVDELRKAQPGKSDAQYRAMVWKENPALRREVEAEQAPAGR